MLIYNKVRPHRLNKLRYEAYFANGTAS